MKHSGRPLLEMPSQPNVMAAGGQDINTVYQSHK